MATISLKFVERFITLPCKPQTYSVAGKTRSRNDFNVDLIAPLLTKQGFEVEGVTVRGEGFDEVVVGRIVHAEPHPNANKLQVCQVDVGEESLRQIVCGAPNARKDLFVAVALPGAKLPAANGATLEIKVSTIRDVVSHGMLCSRAELGLPVLPSIDGNGIWEIEVDAQCGKPREHLERVLGVPLFDALELRDIHLELNILANRPDMRTHAGVARELAVGFKFAGVPYEMKDVAFDNLISTPDLVDKVYRTSELSYNGTKFFAENELGVPAFFIMMDNVKVASSPGWLRNLIESLGQNSINNIVDASNFILLGYGQPSHAFDFDKLQTVPGSSDKKMLLRMGVEGERFVGLDAKERTLFANDCVVADAVKAQALLGVIGGDESKVDESTHTIVLEIANAQPLPTRRMARRHARLTESSTAFEKGLDTVGRWQAACDLTGLIASLSPQKPQFVGAVHTTALPRPQAAKELMPDDLIVKLNGPNATKVCLDASVAVVMPEAPAFSNGVWQAYRANRLAALSIDVHEGAQRQIIGADLVSFAQARDILAWLGFSVSQTQESHTVSVRPPHWRWLDVANVPDVVEEILRVAGIDAVPVIPVPPQDVIPRDDEHLASFDAVTQKAVALGYNEVASFHFMREDDLVKLGLESASALGEPLVLLNPIIRDEPLMQTTLLPDLLRKVSRNLSYGTNRGQLCHICRTYQNTDAKGARVFADNGEMLGLAGKLGVTPERLDEYAPQTSFAYTREKSQERRPAETPRFAGVVFGNREPKSWQNTAAISWDLHSVLAHVRELCLAFGVPVQFSLMEEGHPLARALHPGRRVSFFMVLDEQRIPLGWAGQLHPRALRNFDISEVCFGFELNLASLLKAGSGVSAQTRKVVSVRRFPAVSRDFAVVVDESVVGGQVEQVVANALGGVLSDTAVPARLASVNIFDIYRGKGVPEGKKSLAFNITLDPTERTLTDADIQKVSSAVLESLRTQLGGELRG